MFPLYMCCYFIGAKTMHWSWQYSAYKSTMVMKWVRTEQLWQNVGFVKINFWAHGNASEAWEREREREREREGEREVESIVEE
jgi:hypothetical protein